MMTPEEIYRIWAPESSPWSPWAAPVLFAHLACKERAGVSEEMPPVDLGWLESLAGKNTAIAIDLPGKNSIETGVALARQGYQLVPLYNGVPGQGVIEDLSITTEVKSGATVDMAALMDALCRATGVLKGMPLAPDAPPAFLLDSDRLMGNMPLADGMFDNRWMVFPQNFPSGKFLLSHGIRNAILIGRWTQPREDLAHVLLRWQEAGVGIYSKSKADGEKIVEIKVSPPSRFRRAWYRALAIAGLRRNSTGGFGAIIPPTAAG